MPKHWSEILSCQCGKRFRSLSAEAVHRHNFPMLCRAPKRKAKVEAAPNEGKPA